MEHDDAGDRVAAPLVIHRLDAGTAAALGIEASGARLLRPDGKEAGHWAIFH